MDIGTPTPQPAQDTGPAPRPECMSTLSMRLLVISLLFIGAWLAIS